MWPGVGNRGIGDTRRTITLCKRLHAGTTIFMLPDALGVWSIVRGWTWA